jgi:tripartite-type tricarboxylate transporter receptor subunit TctC
MRRTMALCALTLLGAPFAMPAAAQEWPQRAIRIVAPSTPGGAADMFARLLCDHFTAAFSQACTVDNRAGAGGMIGSAAAANAEPDGYTLTISSLAYHVIAPATAAKASYDPIKDFTHIAYIGGPANVFVSNPKAGMNTLKDVAEQARKAGPLNYVAPGFGTLGHLLVEAFALKENVKTQLILTRGASQAMVDLVAGNVNFGSMTWTSALGQIRSKIVTPVAVSSGARLPDHPDLPTFKDLGRDDLTAVSWFSLSGPAKIPAPVVQRLNAEVAKLLARADVQERLKRDAVETRTMSPEAFTAFVESETRKWAPLARTLIKK